MHLVKVLPIPSFSDFLQKVSKVKTFAASSDVRYQVTVNENKHLFFRRLDAKDKERVYDIDLRKLYEALKQLHDFNTRNFHDFTPGMHSPARALLSHLGLIAPPDPEKIIFFNTGWMTSYKGLTGDRLQGGGKYVKQHGWGGEIFNFLPYRGNLHGYVQPKFNKEYDRSTINIDKLGASPDAPHIDGITVVWTATKPGKGGTRIVGWYKNARVYRHYRPATSLSNRSYKGEIQGFYAEAAEQDCTLLPVDLRKVRVVRGVNGMGQSNVWFADKNPKFVQEVKDYIFRDIRPDLNEQGKDRKGKGARQPDLPKRLLVEAAAIACVQDFYSSNGYMVDSVEADNVGWDLNATDKEGTLKLEVKGLSGSAIATELTPNEYEQLGADMKDYRVCVVTDALNNPCLQIFSYSTEMDSWSDANGVVLNFAERISARISTA